MELECGINCLCFENQLSVFLCIKATPNQPFLCIENYFILRNHGISENEEIAESQCDGNGFD